MIYNLMIWGWGLGIGDCKKFFMILDNTCLYIWKK